MKHGIGNMRETQDAWQYSKGFDMSVPAIIIKALLPSFGNGNLWKERYTTHFP